MKTRFACAMVIATAFGLASAAYSAEPRYKLNKAKTKVVSLSGLASGDMCMPERLSGRVVSRQFAANGVALDGFALESKNGSRDFINIDTAHIQEADMVTIGWVAQGLELFIREGKRVSVGLLRCGAAGRVLYLNSVGSR